MSDLIAGTSALPAQAHRNVLEHHALFGCLMPDELDEVLAFARVETFQARQTIFLKGSPGHELMAVLSGHVQIRAPGANSREAIYDIIEPGEVFGEIALFDGRDRSADAIALSDCRLLVIDRRDFIPFLERHAKVSLSLLAILCDRLRQTTEQVEDLLFLDRSRRMAKKLLSLAATDGERTSGGLRIKLMTVQHELANLVGFSRASIDRQLTHWCRAGILAIGAGHVMLADEARLKSCAEDPSPGTGLIDLRRNGQDRSDSPARRSDQGACIVVMEMPMRRTDTDTGAVS